MRSNALFQLIPVGLGTIVFGTILGLIILVAGGSFFAGYPIVFVVLIVVWVIGLVGGARA